MRALLFITTLLASTAANAATLPNGGSVSLPGTTVAAQPGLAGVVLADDTQSVGFTLASGSWSGVVQSRVVRAADGTLDFYWRVRDTSSTGTAGRIDLRQFRIGDLGTPVAGLDANYRTDGLGAVGPDLATTFADLANLDSLNFAFSNRLAPGDDSYFFFLDTTATRFSRTALFDLTGSDGSAFGYSSLYSTFGVAAVPEPGTWAMMITGFGLVGFAMRGRRREAVAA